ncbi:MAG: SGNH/GDSL hydrolase family protein [Candidatus Nanosalina sp.]
MVQVMVFGHSIAQGFWDPEGGWVQKLRKDLDTRSLENEDEYHEVFNLGVSGNDSEQVLERFQPELEARRWDEVELVVIFEVGANDIHYLNEEDRIRVPREEFEENLRELIKRAKEYTDRVMVIGELYTTIEGPIPWAEEKEVSDERLGKYVETQREVCDEMDVPFVDLRSDLSKEEWSEMLEDGSHPDSRGHKKIYELVSERLDGEGFV